MKGRIFGFQRLARCPKCTPASIKSFTCTTATQHPPSTRETQLLWWDNLPRPSASTTNQIAIPPIVENLVWRERGKSYRANAIRSRDGDKETGRTRDGEKERLKDGSPASSLRLSISLSLHLSSLRPSSSYPCRYG